MSVSAPPAAPSKFSYVVRDSTGKKRTGLMEADSQASVARKLRQLGYAPVSISASNAGMKKEISFGAKRVKLKDLAVFSRQFAVMINSGLSLIRALTILSEQVESETLRTTLRQVRVEVEQGGSLSASFAKHPRIFPVLLINMVRAGEVGGFLDKSLMQLAGSFEAEVKLRGKVKSAMTYPVVVFVMAMAAVTVMLVFVVPRFASIFTSVAGPSTKLPLPTEILMKVSSAMKIAIIPLIILTAVLAVLYRRFKADERLRRKVDPLKLRLPVFGPLFQKIALARFCRNLGTMVRSGVPILQSLDVVADASGNIVLADAVREVQNSVRQGNGISGPLAHFPIFPSMVQQMIAVGEETGALDEMLEKIAEFYDQEVESTAEQLTALIEPLMIAFLGVVVGGMIVALYLPMFSIYNHVQG